jgi:hypothetical protein
MIKNLRVGEAQMIRLCRSMNSTAGDSTSGTRSIG